METSTSMQNFFTFVGRICFSLIFVIAGFMKIMHFQPTAAMMMQGGIPATELILVIAIIIELGAGLMVLLGLWARLGAFLLFLYIIPVTYLFHSFWEYKDAEMINNFQHAFKNLALMGGALYIMAFGAGRWSLKHWYSKGKNQQE